ncbi:RHS repeat domain-containing protein [Chitinophaga sp. XS-30]|uniref:RHS repeat domain-containing protein n=1 Tax=Chitinophaga sp. XS-30 TaxID=2604421 RepID=UPI0011DE47D8|nr:RHS repeat domain-containing protein [Chitinophaga sp. XS-30]QEH41135.1 RHS repeat protein [Chitinophaga sp. XS-30]
MKFVTYQRLFFLTLSLFATQSFAQTNYTAAVSKITPVSPEASSISMYQNYPVDFISGVPQIELPLFDIDTKMGRIPFNLSYHPGKLKSGELTGTIGWGWTLSPNMGVTRSIIGVPDDINRGFIQPNPLFGHWNDCNYLLTLVREYNDEQPDDFYYSLLSGSGRFLYRRDGSFSVPGKISITRPSNDIFQIIDTDGTIYKFGRYSASGSPQVIERSAKGWPFQTPFGEITSWKLTEIISYDKTDTIEFQYGAKATWDVQHYNAQWRIIEYPGNTSYQPQIYRSMYTGANCQSGIPAWEPMRAIVGNSSWLPNITEMYDAFDVNLNEFYNPQFVKWATCRPFCADLDAVCSWQSEVGYTQETVCYYDRISQSTYCHQYPVRHDIENYVCRTGATFSNDAADMPDDEVLTNNRIDEWLLTAVKYRGGKVQLNYDSTTCKKISVFTLRNGAYELLKEINFGQRKASNFNYAGSMALYHIDYRNLLDSVVVADGNGITRQRYKIDYSGNDMLPITTNMNKDMFGFPDNNTHYTMPKMAYMINNYKWTDLVETSSGPQWGASQSGSVMAILGYKQLDRYNENESQYSPPIPLIKKITYPTGGSASFEFEKNRFLGPDYNSIFKGGGYRIKKISYTSGIGQDSIIRSYVYGQNENGAGHVKYFPNSSDYMYQITDNMTSVPKKISIFNSTPFYNMIFDNGVAVLYPEVTEYIGKATVGQNSGKSVYSYFIGGLNNTHVPNSPVQINRRDEWQSTELRMKRDFSVSNNTYKLIKKEVYTYQNFVSDTIRVGAAYQKYFHPSDPVICSNNGVYYQQYDIYPGVKKLTQVQDTMYDQGGVNSIFSTKVYTYDPETLLVKKISTTTSKGETKEERKWYVNDVSELPSWDASQITLLNALKANNRIDLPVKEELAINNALKRTIANYFLLSPSNNQIYPSSILQSQYNMPLNREVEFLQYDSRGRLLEQRKINEVKETYLWGYDGRYPVATIVNADHSTVLQYINQSILSNPSSDSQLRLELQNLRQHLPDAMITSYTYKPDIGVTSMTDPSGRTTYYEYDSFNRLKLIRDQNNHIIRQFCYNYVGEIQPCE